MTARTGPGYEEVKNDGTFRLNDGTIAVTRKKDGQVEYYTGNPKQDPIIFEVKEGDSIAWQNRCDFDY